MPPLSRPLGRRPWLRAAGGAALGLWAHGAAASLPSPLERGDKELRVLQSALPNGPVRFAALPLGGAVEWRRHWDELLHALGRALHRPVGSISGSHRDALAQALEREPIDVAFLSGHLALTQVMAKRMRVVAQMKVDPQSPPRALLLTRRSGMPESLDELLERAAQWRVGRADARSLSGFVVPQAQLLLPRRRPFETAFAQEQLGSHQDNLLALANGDVDLAASHSMDWACFEQQFPQESQRLKVVWASGALPAPALLVSETSPLSFQQAVQRFFCDTTQRTQDPRWVAACTALQMPQGFEVANNLALAAVADLLLALGQQRVAVSQWVSEAAKQTRLLRLASEHRQQIDWLRVSASRAP